MDKNRLEAFKSQRKRTKTIGSNKKNKQKRTTDEQNCSITIKNPLYDQIATNNVKN
jgi:hypothetical protein